jgi:hypothetical protein
MKQLEFNFEENKEAKFIRTLILKSETFFCDSIISVSEIYYGEINITITWKGFYDINIDRRSINNLNDIKQSSFIDFLLKSVKYFLDK